MLICVARMSLNVRSFTGEHILNGSGVAVGVVVAVSGGVVGVGEGDGRISVKNGLEVLVPTVVGDGGANVPCADKGRTVGEIDGCESLTGRTDLQPVRTNRIIITMSKFFCCINRQCRLD